uniref:Uncharacterized protein n=1 Tax=Schizaphis graminum TaxID=13262 RepID=A0A2S2NPG8_SCHGA
MDNVKKKPDVVVPWERPPSWVLVTVYIIIIMCVCVLLQCTATAVAQSSRSRNDDNNIITILFKRIIFKTPSLCRANDVSAAVNARGAYTTAHNAQIAGPATDVKIAVRP